jgi:hypothetical protein
MIRSFSLRDLALLRRLSEQGVFFDAESALTKSFHPLRGALFGMIGGSETPTYIWKAEEGDAAGFAHLQVTDDLNARLVFIGTTPHDKNAEGDGRDTLDETAWLKLLDEVIAVIGKRGIHSLSAEVNESGPELAIMRRAGFAIYTRQDIWALGNPETIPDADVTISLERRRSVDDWDIEWLYANTLPPLIQLVEPSPPQNGNLFLLREDGELAAFVHVAEGPAGTWLQIFIHPNAAVHGNEIVTAAVSLCRRQPEQPIFCCVRRYQSWLQGALQSMGFALCESQAVMVRHITIPVKKQVSALERILAAQGVRPTTLLQRYGTEEEGLGSLAAEEGFWVRNGIDRQSHPCPH